MFKIDELTLEDDNYICKIVSNNKYKIVSSLIKAQGYIIRCCDLPQDYKMIVVDKKWRSK